MPWIHTWFKANPLYVMLASPTTKFMTKAAGLIRTRNEEGNPHPERRDMISRFIETQKTHPGTVTDGVMKSYVVTNLLAGSDTTAVVLRTAVYYAARNPDMMARLQQEFDDAGIAYPPSYKATLGLKYFNAFMYEALRYHPISALLFERVVPPEGMDTPYGHRLRGGTIIGVSPWTTHFDKEVFGADTNSFNPDRWLQGEEESEETYKRRVATMRMSDMAFGKGSRKCLGMHIAQQELWKTIPTFFGLFNVSSHGSVGK